MTLGLFDVAFVGALPRYDADAQNYINRVIAADVAAGNSSGLESGVQDAYNAFFVACKSDGMLNAIKACCIMAGARTLQGCLVPLVGTAPTRFGTAGGWNYNRKTGLQGNGTDNYLDSHRGNNADPQNSKHMSVYAQTAGSVTGYPFIATGAGTGRSFITNTSQVTIHRSSFATLPATVAPTFTGASRASASEFAFRQNGSNATVAGATSETPLPASIWIYRRQAAGAIEYTDARLSFYSIGESLDLALLDVRVTALINAIAAAIP